MSAEFEKIFNDLDEEGREKLCRKLIRSGYGVMDTPQKIVASLGERDRESLCKMLVADGHGPSRPKFERLEGLQQLEEVVHRIGGVNCMVVSHTYTQQSYPAYRHSSRGGHFPYVGGPRQMELEVRLIVLTEADVGGDLVSLSGEISTVET